MIKALKVQTGKSSDLQKSPAPDPESGLEPYTPFTPATRNGKSHYCPDVKGAMCDAVFLASQLPEAPVDLENDLDEVSCAWLRLRRASKCLQQQPKSPENFPGKMWTPEASPPSSADLNILENFYKYVTKHKPSLEDMWSSFSIRTGSLTAFAMRNGLGLLGTNEDTTVEKNGGVWPKELPAPEKMFSCLWSLLRIRGDEIPKDKFVNLKKWIDAEKKINDFVKATGTQEILVADMSGARLRTLMAKSCPKTCEEVVEHLRIVEMLLELEPKASAQLLLDEGAGLLPLLVDTVLVQGLVCIENKSMFLLWTFCQRLLEQATALGYQRPKACSVTQDIGLALVPVPPSGDPPLMPSRRSAGRAKTTMALTCDDSPTSPAGTAEGLAPVTDSPMDSSLLPPITNSRGPPASNSPSTSACNSPKETSALPAVIDKNKLVLHAGEKEGPSTLASNQEKKSPGKEAVAEALINVKSPNNSRKNTKEPRPPEASRKETAEDTPSRPSTPSGIPSPLTLDNAAVKKTIKRRPSLQTAAGTVLAAQSLAKSPRGVNAGRRKSAGNLSARGEEKSSSSGRAGRNLVRRKSITGLSSELEVLKEQTSSFDVSKEEWEFQCCQMIWAFMPPQSITYAIGAGLHSVDSRKLRKEVLRAAWQVLDKLQAVQCCIGIIGTTRLRLEMDMLADQFIRSLHFGADADAEELKEFCGKVRITMVHLESICGADERLAQVAVLYGVAFIAEVMCLWAESADGGASLVSASRSLLHMMNKYLVQLFQRRSELEVPELSDDDGESGDKPGRSGASTGVPSSDDTGRSSDDTSRSDAG